MKPKRRPIPASAGQAAERATDSRLAERRQKGEGRMLNREWDDSSWTFITNHTAILMAIVADPTLTVRQLAQQVGITERRAAQIIKDLREAGYLKVERVGRRSRYQVNQVQSLHRFPVENVQLGEFLVALRQVSEPVEASA